MVIKHESTNVIKVITEKDLIDFIDQSMRIIRNSLTILGTLHDKVAGDIDEDDELEILEDCLVSDINAVLQFKSTNASIYNSINYYLSDIYAVVLNNNKNIEEITDSGVYIDDTWRELLIEENERIVSGFCYILWYEFNFDKLVESLQSSDIEIDHILKGYYDTNNIDVATGVKELSELREQYKFKLLVFDEYPEKEESFLNIMGPYLGGVDDSQLTIELVDQVIDGSITPQELCEMLQSSGGEIQ